ncbi:MAG: thymidylate synthase [Phycisphaerae bacterium]|nr:thymidylate synthase [Phycisphaerae bacterium]
MDQYDEVLRRILRDGVKRGDRTGTGTISVFGCQTRFRIDEDFPIITRRKVWPRSIFGELLWLLSGSTNNKDLQAMGVNFWTPWVDPEFEKANGFAEGELGPVYGFQMRHFDGDYKTKTGGTDQLAYLVNEIKTNPTSRRLLVSYWNPNQLGQMKLPPCHYTFQVYIDDEGRMSGMLTQRSADYPVGVPANIQFYSAFVYMLAQQTGYQPYEFIHNTGDTHIYLNQIEAVEQYLAAEAHDSPQLNLHMADDIYTYTLDDFELLNYNPGPVVKMPISV